jgi:hypothetical protein
VSRAAGRLRYYPLAARKDIKVHLVVPQRWHQFGRTVSADPADDPGLDVHVLPIRLGHAGPMNWYLHFYPGLRRLIDRIEPDVIHLWEEPWSVVALQASMLKRSAALVMEVDQNILKRLPPPFEAIRRRVLRRTDHVLSRGPDATSVVRARGYYGPVSLIGTVSISKPFNRRPSPCRRRRSIASCGSAMSAALSKRKASTMPSMRWRAPGRPYRWRSWARVRTGRS